MVPTLLHSLRIYKRFKVFLFTLFFFIFQIDNAQNPGNLDVTFNPIDNGFGIGDGANNNIFCSVIQPDGKIIISGSFTAYNGVAKNRIVRLNPDGSIDATFNVGTGINNSAHSIVIQPDGKILIGGVFTNYNGVVKNRIARLNSDGSIDSTFNIGTGFPTGMYEYVNSIALQSDGKIIVGGSFTQYNGTSRNNIVRLNANGSLDTTFTTGTGTNGIIYSVYIQPDGKILMGGNFLRYNGVSKDRIARVNSDGTIDTTFNPPTFGVIGTIKCIGMQTNGKIIISGQFAFYDYQSRRQIGRLNTDGSIDFSFNTGSATNFDIYTMKIQTDDKIVIGGNFTSYNGVGVNSVARVNVDGDLDTTFNIGNNPSQSVNTLDIQSNNKIFIAGDFTIFNDIPKKYLTRLYSTGDLDATFNQCLGANLNVLDIAIQPDSKILICGEFTTYNDAIRKKIARINIDGSLDATFANFSNFSGTARVMALQPDGKVLLGGTFNGMVPNLNLYRLNSDGTHDSTFNIASEIGTLGSVYSIVILNDGKILIGGNFPRGIARLNIDGSLDPTFDVGIGLSLSTDVINTIALQSNGKIIVGGLFNSFNSISTKNIVRLNIDGSIDLSFNSSGTGVSGEVFCVKVQQDDKILLGGRFLAYNDISRNKITRLNIDGTLDYSFNSPIMTINSVSDIHCQNNGKIIVAGSFYLNNGLVKGIIRIENNGNLDLSFDVGSGVNLTVNCIALQFDNKVVIGGSFTSYNGIGKTRITRLHGGEIPDPPLNTGLGANNKINTIVLQSNRDLLLGGSFTSYNNTNVNRIAGLKSDGSINPNFNIGTGLTNETKSIVKKYNGKIIVGGSFTSYNGALRNNIVGLDENGLIDTSFNVGSGTNGTVNCIAIQADGKVIIGGSFTTYKNISRNRIARINTDGTLDNTFNPGTGANGDILSIVVQENGKILVGGNFTTFNGTLVNYLTRLNANGSIDGSFNLGGNSANSTINTISINLYGKIFIGGNFTTFNGVNRNKIASLDSDGILNSTFNGSGADDGDIQCINILVNGKILIGGNFTSYNGISRNRIACLNEDGTLDINIVFGAGANDTVTSIVLQSNEKIIVVGAFTTFDNFVANRIFQTNVNNLSSQDNLLKEISLYPNPVVDYLHLNVPEYIILNNYRISDLLGNIIISDQNAKLDKINLISFKKGIYFLEISTDRGRIIKKIIKE